jgi:glycosyltransferase involved in cell wall biosynthesis
MRIVALLAVRNEELYIEQCLRHLISQGVEVCLIDNESSDRTREIAEAFAGRGVSQVEVFPYQGHMDWTGILKRKEELARTIDANWFIHHDADEIRQAPPPFESLHAGIAAADSEGYTAIDFDEFVFLPQNPQESYEGTDYVERMRHYYFFAPRTHHRVNAWKKIGVDVDLCSSGGHQAKFDGRRISPLHFVLRHYIMLSAAHGARKYGRERVYSSFEADELGWHWPRRFWGRAQLRLPSSDNLKILDRTGVFDRSEPQPAHLILAEEPSS